MRVLVAMALAAGCGGHMPTGLADLKPPVYAATADDGVVSTTMAIDGDGYLWTQRSTDGKAGGDRLMARVKTYDPAGRARVEAAFGALPAPQVAPPCVDRVTFQEHRMNGEEIVWPTCKDQGRLDPPFAEAASSLGF